MLAALDHGEAGDPGEGDHGGAGEVEQLEPQSCRKGKAPTALAMPAQQVGGPGRRQPGFARQGREVGENEVEGDAQDNHLSVEC